MVDLVYYLTILFIYFFDVPLLDCHYYINLSLSITSFYGDICLSFDISLSNLIISVSLLTVSEVFCSDFLETFVTFSGILLLIKSPDASAIVWITLFEVFKCFLAECLEVLGCIYPLYFYQFVTNIFADIFSKDENL